MMGVQRSGLLEIAIGLVLLSLVIRLVASDASAQNIRAPSKIVDVTSTIANGDRRFRLNQMIDGITADTGNFNGFVGRRGQRGSITLTLDAKYDLNAFHIWNDVNVRAEGVENFTLRFFSDGQPMHAQKFSGRNAIKPGVVDMQTFRLDKTVKNVNRVILQVDKLMKRPNTYAEQVEIREVAFSGDLSGPLRAQEKAEADAKQKAAEEKAAEEKAAEEKTRAKALALAEAEAKAKAEAEKFGDLVMVHRDIPDFEPSHLLFFSRADDARLDTIAADNGLTVRAKTVLDQIGLTMVSARIEPGDTVSEAVARLNALGAVEWAEPNAYFQLLDGETRNSRGDGLRMHGLMRGGSNVLPPLASDATIALIDSPVDVGNRNFVGARIEQRAVGVPDEPSPHGTAIAELLIGTGDFGGVATGARLVSFAAFEEVGDTGFRSTSEKLAKALNAASRLRPHVVNLSFGSDYKSRVLAQLLQVMDGNGICLASAAGNKKNAPVLFPANHASTLAITAVEQGRRIYEHASIGDEVDVAAWGVAMNAAVPGGRRTVSGTSFATAIVSGAMLRMPACTGARDPAAMRDAIKSDAEDLGDVGEDPIFGAGLFLLGDASLAAMVRSDAPPPAEEVPEIEEPTNPLLYAAGGAGAAGAGFLFFFSWRRRKEQQQPK